MSTVTKSCSPMLNHSAQIRQRCSVAEHDRRRSALCSRRGRDAPPPVVPPIRNGLDISLITVKNFLLRESALFSDDAKPQSSSTASQFLISVGIIKTINEISSGLPDRDAISVTADRLAALDRRYDLTVLIIPSRGLWVGARRSETREVHARMVRHCGSAA